MQRERVHFPSFLPSFLQGEEPVDTQALPDRRRALKPGQQDVWAEAQRMFQDKLADKIAGGEIAAAGAQLV